MAFPWLRVVNTLLGLTELALRRRAYRPLLGDARDRLAVRGRVRAPIEARVAGVIVAALREALDRDHQRMELERQQMEAERQRAERALRLELRRQAANREINRLRLVSVVAVASWLGTLLATTRFVTGPPLARAALAFGWLLLLGSLGAAFAGQAQAAAVSESDDRTGPSRFSSGPAGAMAPWLAVAGLGIIGVGVLFMS